MNLGTSDPSSWSQDYISPGGDSRSLSANSGHGNTAKLAIILISVVIVVVFIALAVFVYLMCIRGRKNKPEQGDGTGMKSPYTSVPTYDTAFPASDSVRTTTTSFGSTGARGRLGFLNKSPMCTICPQNCLVLDKNFLHLISAIV